MDFDWRDYLGLAHQLLYSSDEASQRSAISRAYYAAYGVASARLGYEPPPSDGVGIHQTMWNEYAMSADRTRRSIGQSGNRLRHDRNEADYEIRLPDVRKRAEKAVKLADSLLTHLALV